MRNKQKYEKDIIFQPFADTETADLFCYCAILTYIRTLKMSPVRSFISKSSFFKALSQKRSFVNPQDL